MDPIRWDELATERALARGENAWLGFVASATGASLIAYTDDGLLVPLLQIERDDADPPDWRVPRVDVQDSIAAAFAEYRIVRLLADPHGWRDEVAEWSATHGEDRVLEFPTNSVRRLGPAVDRFREAVAEGRVHHEDDPHLTAHVLNARLHRSRTRVEDHDLFTLEKPARGRLIDGAVAAVLAYEGHAQAPPPEPGADDGVGLIARHGSTKAAFARRLPRCANRLRRRDSGRARDDATDAYQPLGSGRPVHVRHLEVCGMNHGDRPAGRGSRCGQ